MVKKTLNFAQIVKDFRLQRGLSQNQLAQAAHLSRVYVYHLETGLRQNPSERVVQHLAQALVLQEDERRIFYAAFTQLTGRDMSEEGLDLSMLHVQSLAHLLVLNSTYPAHALDRLWYVQLWNKAALELFEIQAEQGGEQHIHLLELLFGAHRPHFLAWENLARRLVNDFLYTTRALVHLPAYQEVWRRLRELPDFRRLAAVSAPEPMPSPSFVFSLQHGLLGCLTVRTAPTVFTRVNSYCMVSYLPGDQQTLGVYQKCRWQPDTFPLGEIIVKLFS